MRKIFIILLVLMSGTLVLADEAVKVIVNNNVSVVTIERVDLEKIYLGKKTSWSNGSKILPVMLKGGETHEHFVKSYVKKTPPQFSAFWKQAIFTGKGVPPKSFTTESELVDYVAKTSGAIGYVSPTADIGDAKVVQIVQ